MAIGNRSWKPDEIVEHEGQQVAILRERCWQCRKHSQVRLADHPTFGSIKVCLNNCGPEALGRVLTF